MAPRAHVLTAATLEVNALACRARAGGSHHALKCAACHGPEAGTTRRTICKVKGPGRMTGAPWRVKDSNLRRQSRRIYSPLPLAARATRHDAGRGYTALQSPSSAEPATPETRPPAPRARWLSGQTTPPEPCGEPGHRRHLRRSGFDLRRSRRPGPRATRPR